MDSQEYKNAKVRLGISVPDVWCNYFGITKDQDKSYSSGRTKVSEDVKKWIEEELLDQSERVDLLINSLKACYPTCKVKLNQENYDIDVVRDESNVIKFENRGKSNLCVDLYVAETKKREKISLVFYPKMYWSKDKDKLKDKEWALWNATKRNSRIGPLTTELTQDLFKALGLALSSET